MRKQESKLRRCVMAPMRFLSKARDLYIKGMTECSGQFAYMDAAMGCPAGQLSALPRSFSISSSAARSSSADDYKHLIRAASVRSTNGNVVNPGKLPAGVPRSRSVGIGRIDEDKPCDFGDDLHLMPNFYSRSRSYALHRRSASGML